MKNIKVTIGITTYNLEKYIAQALDSILMQKTNFDFDILVIDDASTDKTQAIIKKYAKKYPQKVKYLFNKKNGGSLYSSNKLFNHIHSPYISFLDGDDYWLDENRLQKQVDFLDAHPEYTMVAGNTLYEKDGKLTDEKIVDSTKTLHTYAFDDYLNKKCPFIHTSSILLRNIVYNKGMPKEYIDAENTMDNLVYRGEDIRFLHHLQKGKIFIFPDIFSVYRIHKDGMWSGASELKKILEMNIRNIRYTDIFYEYREFFLERFFESYPYSMSIICKNLVKNPNISLCEKDLLQYLFEILYRGKLNNKDNKTKRVNEKKVKKLKYRILLKIYNKIRKKLSKKGYIND